MSKKKNLEKEALSWVTKSENVLDELKILRVKIDSLEEEIDQFKKNIKKENLNQNREPLWILEQELFDSKESIIELEAKRRRYLQQALIISPNLSIALEILSNDCIQRHKIALNDRQVGLARSIKSEAQEYIKGLSENNKVYKNVIDYFDGDRSVEITLSSDCEVQISKFVTKSKRYEPEFIEKIQTQKIKLNLPVGSYVFSIESEGNVKTQLPIFLENGKDWNNIFSDGSEQVISIPSISEMGDEDCFIPPGWFYAGGDLEAPNSLEQVKVWVDGFIIRETPVTHFQYLEFINDLLVNQGEEEANLWLPREQSSSNKELGKSIYIKNGNKYQHMLGDKMNHHPVVNVTWFQTLAFTRWLSNKTGHTWRLPMELEWEKSARGVDRRCFPWGDNFDPMFCVMMDSHAGEPKIRSVKDIQLDKSLYGVRSLAGNTREWCIDLFNAEKYSIKENKALFPTYENLISDGFRSCRGGSYGNAATRTRSSDRDWWFPELSYVGRGFRIARSWPENDSSRKLNEDIESAYNFTRTKAIKKQDVAAENLKLKIESATSDLREEADQLKSINQQKTTFFQNISHELRTPLTLIMNPLESLAKEMPNESRVKVARQNTTRLYRLVNQLLDFEKLSAGKKKLDLRPINLVRFLNTCSDMFISTASSKNIKFQYRINGSEYNPSHLDEIHILGEIDSLEKIIFNYLSNALKYSPNSSEIYLDLISNEDKVKIVVQAQGKGISKENQKKLFEVFSQVDESTTREHEGTGLGLALVKNLASLMKTEVGVISAP